MRDFGASRLYTVQGASTGIRGAVRRFGFATLMAALASTGIAVAPASAIPSLGSTTGISPDSNLSNGSDVLVTTDAPFTVPGASIETITQTFDNVNAPVLAGEGGLPVITTPEGYAVEYYYDGAWSSTPPSPVGGVFPTLQKVRAIGSNVIAGWDSSTASESYSRPAASVPAPTRSFSGSGMGDGWDVFFGSGSAAGKIFNVYHHGWGTVGFECHNQLDGSSCWSGGNFLMGEGSAGVSGTFWSSARSTGFYAPAVDQAYTFVAYDNGDGGMLGLACIKNVSTTTPSPCNVPFVSLESAAAGYLTAGDAVQVGTKVYARGTRSGENMLCFDLATQAACGGQPYSIGSPAGTNSWEDARLVAVGTDVYFTTGSNLGCFDTITHGLCAHFNSGATLAASTSRSIFYTETTEGTPNQVCTYGNQSCWGLDGTAGTWPAGMAFYYSSINDGWGAVHNSATRVFYLNGSTTACYDFLTAAACDGFTNPVMGGYAYAFATDPANTMCVWGNSDQGLIINFDWSTGLPCGQRNTVMFRYTDSVPRLSCTDTGRVTQWDSLTLHAPRDLNIADARISVYTGNGDLVTGWEDLPVTSSSDTQTGTLDLASLSVSDSGVHPAFYVAFVGTDDVTGTLGDFAYSAAAPQICASVHNFVPCPSGVGNGAPDFPYSLPNFGIASLVQFSGAAEGSEDSSASATRQALTSTECLLLPSGGYVLTDITEVPIPGLIVYLYGPDTTTPVETATTDAEGFFEFLDLYPNTYQVSVSSQGVDAGISSEPLSLSCTAESSECSNWFGTLYIPFKVHYLGNGNTDGTAPADEYVTPGQTFTPTSGHGTLVKSHYHFLGWGAAETSTAVIDTFTVTGDQNVYAVWEIDTHTLTTIVDGNGSVSPEVGPHVYNYGDTSTVTQTPGLGWAFTGWSGACVEYLPCVVLIQGDTSVTAHFTRLFQLDVTIVGVGSASPGSSAYNEGSVFHFLQQAAPGYRFAGFSGDCTGNTCDITMNADHRVVVTFVQVFQLTTKVSGNGSVTAGGVFDRGAAATIRATADSGWRFAGWTGDCSGGDNPFTVSMTRDLVCTANFSDQPVLTPVPSGRYAPASATTSTIVWKSVTSATKYKITVNGKLACVTSELTCSVRQLLGPKSKVYAIAMTETLEAIKTQLVYKRSAAVRLFVVNFGEGSSVLTAKAKAKLRAESIKIKALGFTSVTVIGFTDSQGGVAGALPLSSARARNVAQYLRQFGTVAISTAGRGNTQFVAANVTERGRAANRRAEGWVK